MTSLTWAIAETLTFAADVAIAQWYLCRKLGHDRTTGARMLIAGLMITALLTVCYFLSVPETIRMPVLAVACVFNGLYSARGTVAQRVFHSFISFFLVIIADCAVIALLTLLPGVTFNSVIQPTAYRLQAMVASKMLLLFLAFLFSARAAQPTGRETDWVMVLPAPIISLGVITALLRYETVGDGERSYGLGAISFGLFILNVVLLVLQERLAAKARQLAEKEKMLHQAELQNRYFAELNAAADSLRGFRHDLKNHLQVLSGLLEMNKTAQAREYLSDIGNFVAGGDFDINSGHPLVDAVLGMKVALARHEGIAMTHTVKLGGGVAMEPMDLCGILGNVMDNAIEACGRMAPGAERAIEVTLLTAEGEVLLTVCNTVDSAELQAGRASQPASGHGFGLANVRKTVEKYGGVLDIDHRDGMFRLQMMIPAGYPVTQTTSAPATPPAD